MKIAPILLSISTSLFCCTAVFAKDSSTPGISDQQFVRLAAQTDMLGAHMGQMAEKHASQRGVKDFGESVNLDDLTSYQSLCSIADNLGLPVPKAINKDGDKVISELARANGRQFDHRFVRNELKTDQKVISAYEQEAHNGHDPALKAFASNQLPTVKLDLNEAQDLAGHSS